MSHADGEAGFDPRAITRPDPSLLTYYALASAFLGPFFPFAFIPLWIRYRTLRYAFDDEGVSMAWGLLFKKEILLTYRRIQDIHVKRNLIHRWLGLSSLAVQTASGASGAEMTIEGVRFPERLRDFLYAQMRGAREEGADSGGVDGGDAQDEALALLEAIRDELRAIREARS